MTQAFLIRDKYREIQSEINELRKQQQELVNEAIDNCEHPIESIYELPYKDKGYLGTDFPWLICFDCGLTEEGWGCGYNELAKADRSSIDTPKITRKRWYEMRSRSIFQDGRIVQ